MATPLIRDEGATLSVTGVNTVANNAYCTVSDALRIQNNSGYLLADFRLTNVSFAASLSVGTLQLAKINRDWGGGIGPTPAATLIPNEVWTFSPMPGPGNTSKAWNMGINSVPLTRDQDFWVFNNGTGVALGSAWNLAAIPWSPGT